MMIRWWLRCYGAAPAIWSAQSSMVTEQVDYDYHTGGGLDTQCARGVGESMVSWGLGGGVYSDSQHEQFQFYFPGDTVYFA